VSALLIPIDADAACTRGHFPDHPIVPGAYLLDAVIRAIAADIPVEVDQLMVESAKFPHPVLPGQCVALEYDAPRTTDAGLAVKFRAKVGEQAVIMGALTFGTVR